VLLGGTGIWAHQLRYGDPGAIAEMAAELDELGYSALWIPDVGGDVLGSVETLLRGAPRAVVATGILNIWMHEPADVAAHIGGWDDAWKARFLLGLGASHAPLIDHGNPGRYQKPYTKMFEYLDGLDGAHPPLTEDRRVLAALGPRMLELARDRAAGAHPYFVPPEHTAQARERLGPGKLLAPEQKVVLETDPEKARAIARPRVANPYLGLTNYVSNLRRIGWSEEDVAHDGSDALIDALAIHGDGEALARGVAAHLDAGADHVAVQVLARDPLPALRAIAASLGRTAS